MQLSKAVAICCCTCIVLLAAVKIPDHARNIVHKDKLHLTLTILRASTTKAPRLSLNTFLLLRSKEWQRPFADMTLVRADVSTLLKPSSFCSASSCSPAQAMELSLRRCQAKFDGMTIDHQTCQKRYHLRLSLHATLSDCNLANICSLSGLVQAKLRYIVRLHFCLCQSHISPWMITCKLQKPVRS